MSQPQWKLVANLGDVTYLNYGGFFVYVDETGVYPAEAEVLVVDNEHEIDDESLTYTVYRFALTKCTLVNGVLSDNPYHPDMSAWFANDETEKESRIMSTCLSSVSRCLNRTVEHFALDFCSDDIIVRAIAYREVAEYHGYDEFDQYPLKLTRAEAESRYAAVRT
jgi:hypothetical protein